ncbi:Membrane primary amine oxidase [Paramyrothecium foliicola]|nr:Membrane primary amine oxidase [Paramyrothecium foliicola]
MARLCLKTLATAVLTLGVLCEARLSSAPGSHSFLSKKSSPQLDKRFTNSSNGCNGTPDAPSIAVPYENIWNSLTRDEVVGLLEWLHHPAQGLNLTSREEAGAWDNTVGVTELLAPNKTDALAYLEGRGPAPVRNARVGIFFGATEEPYMQAFIVGPLPVSSQTTIAPLDYIYTKETGRMPNYNADAVAVVGFQLSVTATIADITLDLLGVSASGSENDTALLGRLDPLQQEDGRIIDWIAFYLAPTNGFGDATILVGGMWLKFDITGRDPSGWSCLGVLYNDIFYETVEELRAAWERPDFVKLTKALDGDFGSTARRGAEMPYDTLPGPAMIETAKRYAVNRENNYVRWMDYNFFLAFDRDTGLKFYDVQFQNARIIFELGVQEAHAHYAANNPVQSGSAYLDSWYGLGTTAYSLVPGWDCPAHATYLDTVVHDNAMTTTHNNSICIFEQDAGYPITRHTAGDYVTVTKNAQLVVRWISVVGNYDYLFEYVFNLDGTIEVKVKASGYIQGAYYAHNEEYGYRIHDALSGAMHDHVVNYKLDLDVNGTANSLERVEFVPHTTTYSWSKQPRNTMKIQKSWVNNEDESKLKWAPNSASSYVIVNKDKPNPYGEYPGYKISPNLGSPVYLTVQNSSSAQRTVNFATHNLFATKQKDTEPRSAAAWNNQDPYDPLVDFNAFFDGESLDQEDLVIWFNLGMHHVPHTGDLPNTVYTTAQAGIAISPHNYLLGDPSRATSHSVYVDLTKEPAVESSYGGEQATCAYDMSKLYPDLSDYVMGETLRKWPQVYVGGGS